MAFVVPVLASIGTAFGASASTAALVGAGITAAGVSTVGSLIKGESQAAANDYNASIARQNALIAQQQGAAAVQAQQRDAARTIGRAIANYGASGVQVDQGSPMDVLAESVRNAELDKLNIQYNYALKAQGYTQQAQLDTMGAKTSRTSGYLNATANVVRGASDYTQMTGSPIPMFG